MNTIYFDSDDNEAERRAGLYDGQIYVYSPTKSGLALCKLAQDMCAEAFHPHFPPDAQHHLGVDEYVEILKTLKPSFIHHPDCKRLIPSLLEELGCDLEHTYFDVPRLRTACSGDYLSSGLAYAFKPHRDTWYSTPMAQLNWWLPVYPITSDNAMAFHPNYWDKPVLNSSSLFDYQDWNQGGRRAAEKTSWKRHTRTVSSIRTNEPRTSNEVGHPTRWCDYLCRRADALHRSKHLRAYTLQYRFQDSRLS